MKGVTMKKTIMISMAAAFIALSFFALTTLAGDAWIGIYTQTVDEDLKDAFELDYDNGVIIKMIVPDSPADKAGLEQGDIIIAIDGEDIKNSDELIDFVEGYKPGERIKIKIVRDGDEDVVAVKLGERGAEKYYDKALDKFYSFTPKSDSKSFYFFDEDNRVSDVYMGVQLRNLNVQLGEYFGIEDGKGALIEEVTADSPAKKAGLEAGDVIIAVEGEEIEGPAAVTKLIRQKDEGDEIKVSVLRRNEKKEFTVTLEKAPDDFGTFFWKGHILDSDEDFFFMPRMKGLFKGDYDYNLHEEDNLQQNMDDLEDEIEELRQELKELKKKLD